MAFSLRVKDFERLDVTISSELILTQGSYAKSMHTPVNCVDGHVSQGEKQAAVKFITALT